MDLLEEDAGTEGDSAGERGAVEEVSSQVNTSTLSLAWVYSFFFFFEHQESRLFHKVILLLLNGPSIFFSRLSQKSLHFAQRRKKNQLTHILISKSRPL